MIDSITLKFGRAPGRPSEVLQASPVTVFVGPNHSGKSKALAEIYRYCSQGRENQTDVILEAISFQPSDEQTAQRRLEDVRLSPRPSDSLSPDNVLVGRGRNRNQVQENAFLQALQDPNALSRRFCPWYLSYHTLMLDGKSRIDLVADRPMGDLQESPQNSLQVLFQESDLRREVRRIVNEAFGDYFVLDPTNVGKLRIRLSKVPPQDERQECGIHETAVQFHGDALHIQHASDGIKAFTGIITEVVAGDPRVLLIDEPEAFLHPSLCFNLGKEIAKSVSGTNKRLIAATHSSHFVMGCIQSGAPVNIVRLTYRDEVPTARILENAEILQLMRNPLLRSTGVLSGLFYESVVVTESDADRAFYQEVNERLIRFRPEWGIPNCLFLNAQNRQTVKSIIRPLRQLGIPTAAIIDIDVIKEGGSVWTDLLGSASVPAISRQPLSAQRAAIKTRFQDSQYDMKRDGGVAVRCVTCFL